MLEPIQSVDVIDPLTVQVTMKQPWVSFDAQLYGSGRFGMMAQAQLDDTQSCAENLIGTGPFKFVDWVPNQKFEAEKNEDYWATDAAGQPAPVPRRHRVPAHRRGRPAAERPQSGEINAMHERRPDDADLRDLSESGELNTYESEEFGEVSYIMLNESTPPFDNIKARQALAYAADFDEINAILNDGITTQATGPFAPATSATSRTPASPPTTRPRPSAWSGSTRPRPARTCRSPTPPPTPR